MAKQIDVKETISLPEGISATVENGLISITGPKGSASKNFLHPKVIVSVSSEGIIIEAPKFSKMEKKVFNTFKAHIANLVKGVTEGHEYKLKICSGHFPMNVSLKNNKLEVKNFIGESVPRTLTFKEGVDVKLNGEIIQVTGINKELVSQAAASIEQLTRRNGFDRRIFQDGIYIIEKDGKVLE